ncbi:hypothetical protein K435DRAFT_864847 [Dendrothele bispora CBS 962.96]|uniref:Uncharacterized protein n=1 Tax=Dendrothele bispora (strain CBS 962.96) TaxID=1314807 RepID=A0A4S8LKZ6_DENBC|nr:hypothetical protein K435DRAFT_864847 [Dendrothele bispora CBS 962.96]
MLLGPWITTAESDARIFDLLTLIIPLVPLSVLSVGSLDSAVALTTLIRSAADGPSLQAVIDAGGVGGTTSPNDAAAQLRLNEDVAPTLLPLALKKGC